MRRHRKLKYLREFSRTLDEYEGNFQHVTGHDEGGMFLSLTRLAILVTTSLLVETSAMLVAVSVVMATIVG